jgi:exopolysaccharide biosynthesis polyprenyl glycosylphosphotransferase
MGRRSSAVGQARVWRGDPAGSAAQTGSKNGATAAVDGRAGTRRRFKRPSIDAAALEYQDRLAQPLSGSTLRRDSIMRRALAAADVVGLATAFAVSGFAVPRSLHVPVELPLTLALWVLGNKLLGLYDRDPHVIDKSTVHELPTIAESVVIGITVIFLLAPWLGLEVHRLDAVQFLVTATIVLSGLRWLVRAGVRRIFGPERAVIVGSGAVADLLARKIKTHHEYGVEVVGCIDIASSSNGSGNGGPSILGDVTRLDSLTREFAVNRVIVAFSSLTDDQLLDAVRTSRALGLKLTVVPRLYEVIGRSLMVDEVEGMSVLGLRSVGRTRSSLFLKRAIDACASGAGLVLLSPLLLTIAVAVKLTSRGPVLFAQDRIGRGNQVFKMHKFRTMVVGAEAMKSELAERNEAEYPMFKISNDPRLTKVGRVLRRYSLDELPQLWNVLRGEMSLVGPRPLVPSEDAHVIGWHRARLELTPGLTGPWQVLGRNAIPFQEMVKLDYVYVADWSLWNDVKLLIRTVPVVFSKPGC